jgi:hypothetical protein
VKTIVAGSRDVTDMRYLHKAIKDCGWVPSCVVSGTARGADRLGETWAVQNGVPCLRFPADWNKHGKSAGYKRNELMADNADALIALWDGVSPGTKHMIDIARRKNLRVYVQLIPEDVC